MAGFEQDLVAFGCTVDRAQSIHREVDRAADTNWRDTIPRVNQR